MRQSSIMMAASLGLLATTAATPLLAAPLSLGAAAPLTAVKMVNVDQKKVSVADAKGDKGTLVLFTCNHCPYVKAWESRITQIGNDAMMRGVGVIAINSNDPATFEEDKFEEMQRRSKALGLRFPYVVDAGSKLARAYGATRTPEIFLFNAADELVYHGTIDDNVESATAVKKHFLKDAVGALVAGKPIRVTKTKALGCSIKFRDS